MRPQSGKARKVAAARRDMWRALGPVVCCRCHAAPAVDLHEKLCRSRGGDPADPAACWPVCRQCHDEIHASPAQATEDGWLISSWDARDDEVTW